MPRLVVWGAAAVLIGFPVAWHFTHVIPNVSPRADSKTSSRSSSVDITDTAARGSVQWVRHGLPPFLQDAALRPWIVADPKNPAASWWLWPTPYGQEIWLGKETGSHIIWKEVSLAKPQQRYWPRPWRQFLTWAVDPSKSVQGFPPSVVAENFPNSRSHVQSWGSIIGLTAVMQPQPDTVVLGVLTQSAHADWRILSPWRYHHGWQALPVIVERWPSSVRVTQVLSSPPQGFLTPPPGWAQSALTP